MKTGQPSGKGRGGGEQGWLTQICEEDGDLCSPVVFVEVEGYGIFCGFGGGYRREVEVGGSSPGESIRDTAKRSCDHFDAGQIFTGVWPCPGSLCLYTTVSSGIYLQMVHWPVSHTWKASSHYTGS